MLIHPVLASAIDLGEELLGLAQQGRRTPPQDPDDSLDDCLGWDAWVNY
ncbi:MAG: hypothetical protein PVF93_11225 [Chromatiaceae bacterium]